MTTKNGLPPIHPGVFLAEILHELEISQAELARAINVSAMQVSHIIHGNRSVDAELALRLAKAFGQTPEYWLNLQSSYDLKTAKPQLKSVRRLVDAAA